MFVLDKWLELNHKTPFIQEYMKFNRVNKINLKEVKSDIRRVLAPFIFGKFFITENEIDYINNVFKTEYQLKSFYNLYRELYLNKQVGIVPSISLWNNYQVEQYLAVAVKGDLKLFGVEIPIDNATDNLFIELYIKNYLNIFNNFDRLDINYNNSVFNLDKPTINIIDSSNASPYDITLGISSGLNIGEYIATDDTIILKINNSIKYWDCYNGNLDVDLSDIKLLSQILTKPGISDENKNKQNLINIKKSYLLDLIDRNSNNQ